MTTKSDTTLTEKLRDLYLVDLQIRGLSNRVNNAESFLKTQTVKLETIKTQQAEIDSRVRQHQATTGNLETEIASIDVRIEKHRTELNSAVNNKQYSALLNEVTILKESRGEHEELMLSQMESIEELKEHLQGLKEKLSEREDVVNKAETTLKTRENEVKERLTELQKERSEAAANIPKSTLETYQDSSDANHGETMATIDEIDVKRKQYSCGSCYTMLPFDLIVTAKSSADQIVLCSSCQRILRFGEPIDFED